MARPAVLGFYHTRATRREFLRVARECGFDLRRIASRLAVSERTVKRLIRDAFDRAAADWLKEQRLCVSLYFLAEHRSVKLAAVEAGFKQQSHFSREFKKAFRISPSSYLETRFARSFVLSG